MEQNVDSLDPFDDVPTFNVDTPWPSDHTDLRSVGKDWWLTACVNLPLDRWIGYVTGYWRAAEVLVSHMARTGRDQDYLVYPFLMCWRHYVELQLKVVIRLIYLYQRTDEALPRTHKIDVLWKSARRQLEEVFPEEPHDDLDNTERVLLQLNALDPTSEHFRYPITKDGSGTMPALQHVHMRRFHEAMDGVAHLLDAADAAIRQKIDARNEYESAMRDLYGVQNLGWEEYF